MSVDVNNLEVYKSKKASPVFASYAFKLIPGVSYLRFAWFVHQLHDLGVWKLSIESAQSILPAHVGILHIDADCDVDPIPIVHFDIHVALVLLRFAQLHGSHAGCHWII